MRRSTERCRDTDRRRRDLRARKKHERGWNGIDYLEVDETQKILTVFFIGPVPEDVTKANVRIDGGRRVRNIRVVDVRLCEPEDPRADGCLQVLVDRPGDFSMYTLRIVESSASGRPGNEPLPGFDRRYAQLDFTFKVDCDTGLDCAPAPCPPAVLEEPEIDYLAKDYATFRQLILDRLSLLMPDWKERHVPDVGIALVELLAYTGDYLSAYQDAVATEAYLHTARQRISVRRHARLVDYHVHEGCNARAWVYIETDTDSPLDGVAFLSPTKARAGWNRGVLGTDDLVEVPATDYEVFLPLGEPEGRVFHVAHNRIAFYTWGDRECCLPRGATSATLADQWTGDAPPPEDESYDGGYGKTSKYAPPKPPSYDDGCPPDEEPPPPRSRALHLQPGDVLIFEEVLGPITGEPADADPLHRHVVRLTRVEANVDPLYDQPVIDIEWAEEDALPFPLCISAIGRAPDCRYLDNITIAHGNVVLVDHGRPVGPESWDVPPAMEHDTGCYAEGDPIEEIAPVDPFRPPELRFAPVTHATPFPPPRVVARRQAELLARLLEAVRARVEALWRAARDGRALTTAELDELRTIFGAKSASAAGLNKHATRMAALARLLARGTPELDKKARRVRVLVERARAGYVLDAGERDELTEMFGEAIAARAGIGSGVTYGPASLALLQNPREAIPAIVVTEHAIETTWLPKPDLLDSIATDRHFVVETDNESRAHVRFGDGDRGRAPSHGSSLAARYRTGNGTRGNVGAEAISRILFPDAVVSGRDLHVRNPLAARGGADPEPLAEVRLYAPGAFRREIERAVIGDDYARLAERANPNAVQRAAAPSLRWTGSWYEAAVAIDPRGSSQLGDLLREEIDGYLHRYRRIGHDVRVSPARYVPLDVAVFICVRPHYLRAHVQAEVLEVLGNRGLFHPDRLTFGEGVRLSAIVAAAQAVTGVESVTVKRLQRLYEEANLELDEGILRLGAVEVARLDNDPGEPGHGRLELLLGGGR
jgi:predicted phage baseplate assembly protein